MQRSCPYWNRHWARQQLDQHQAAPFAISDLVDAFEPSERALGDHNMVARCEQRVHYVQVATLVMLDFANQRIVHAGGLCAESDEAANPAGGAYRPPGWPLKGIAELDEEVTHKQGFHHHNRFAATQSLAP